jgi:hypothetical protein
VVPAAGAGAGAGAAGAGAGAGAGAAKSDAEWLRGERHVFEPADIQALMQDPGLLESAAAMQRCAADRGISIPHESAQELVKRWLMQEKAAQVLKAARTACCRASGQLGLRLRQRCLARRRRSR